MVISDAVRAAMMPYHQKLEDTKAAQALRHGRFSPQQLAHVSGILATLHTIAEPALERDPPLWQALGRPDGRAAAAQRDLIALGGRALDAGHPLTVATQEATTSRGGLVALGFLTVGSRAGSAILAPVIAARLGRPLAPGNGFDLHLDALGGGDWQRAKAALDALITGPALIAQAAESARTLMGTLFQAFASIPDEDGP